MHRQLESRARVIVVAICLVVVGIAGQLAPASAAPESYLGILPELREDIRSKTAGKVSSYDIDVRFDPATSTVSGRLRLRLVNHYGQPLTDVAFRLYPNAYYYGEGEIRVSGTRIEGQPVEPTFEADETAMRLPLPSPLQPSKATTVEMRFATVVPTDSSGTFGIFSRDSRRGTWVLADWYPIVAGWEAETGWRLAPPTDLGDPTFSYVALYDVAIRAPAELVVVATGSEVETREEGQTILRRFVSGPAREFALVLDDDYVSAVTDVGGIRISVYANAGTIGAENAELALNAAKRALAAYSDRYGPYPYEELDLVETELGGALGVSWAGLIFLDSDDLLAQPIASEQDVQRLTFTVTHEVGHQWWGSVVGANSNDYPYLVEGLTNYLTTVSLNDTVGPDVGYGQLRLQIVLPYLEALDRYGDGVVSLPITEPQEHPPRSVLIYAKAALGFLAIRAEIGDEAFFAGLRDYADSFAFGIATPDDLRRAFERAGGVSLEDTWRFWFESAETTPTDVQELLDVAA